MEKMHQHILQLLKEIDGICRKYDIEYYAAGGTTIGAVRHNGFIPWDDDADLYMTRDNFYRFREAFYKEQPENRALEFIDDNPEYPSVIPRYIDLTKTALCRFHVLNTSPAGLIIDIFILDPIPGDKELQDEYFAKFNVYNDLVMPYYVFSYRNKEKYYDLYEHYKEKAERIGRDAVLRELEQDLFTYKEDECDYYTLRWGTAPAIFSKEMIGKPVYFKFEDMELPVPEKWWDYLYQLYGADWMYIPAPANEYHHTAVINMDLPYTYYTDQLDELIDKEQALKDYQDRKDTRIDLKKARFTLDRELLKVNAEYALYLQQKTIRESGADLKDLLENKEYERIISMFRHYLDLQLSKHFCGRGSHGDIVRFRKPLYVDLPDDQLYVLLYALIATGQQKKAERIFRARERYNRPLTDELQQIAEFLQRYKTIINAYYSGRSQEARAEFEKLSDKDKELPILKKINFLMLAETTDSAADPKQIETELLNALQQNPNDLEITKAYGDFLYNQGKTAQAKEQYEIVPENSRNGIILLDINRKFSDLSFRMQYEAAKAKAVNAEQDSEDNQEDEIVEAQQAEELPSAYISEYQQVQLKLLKEIKEICSKNNIKFHLIAKTAIYAYYKNAFEADLKSNTILMTAEGAKKFIEAVNASALPNRKIHSMLTDSEHLHYDLYYIATDTLDYSLFHNTEANGKGIFITIKILRKKSNQKRKNYQIRLMEILHESYLVNLPKHARKKDRIKKVFGHSLMSLYGAKGRARLAQKLFNTITETTIASKKNKSYYIADAKGFKHDNHYYKNYSSKKTIYAKLYDSEFPLFEAVATLVREPKDFDFDTRSIFEKRGLYHFVDSSISFEEFAENVDCRKIKEILIKDYPNIRKLQMHQKKINATTHAYWETACMLEDQRLMQEKYNTAKKDILNLFENGYLDNLIAFTKEYSELITYYSEQKLKFYTDAEIHGFYSKWLKISKWLNAAEQEEHNELD